MNGLRWNRSFRRERKPAEKAHAAEVLLLVPVGNHGQPHLTSKTRDCGIAELDPVAGTDPGSSADGGGVGQPSRGHARVVADGGVVAAAGIRLERRNSDGGVAV